jgi:glycosyltransferase involved in cell wall biosynthesis
MKVLHVSTYDTMGGAAKAACRLHRSLQQIGIQSEMLVQDRQGDDNTVHGPSSTWGKFLGRYINPRIDTLPVGFYRNRKKTPFHIQWLPTRTIRKIRSMNPDIVHLHWICDGFVRIGDLACINKPIVWTLHDSWPFTGGCHVPGDCTGYQEKCGSCPQLGSKKEYDLSRWIWRKKNNVYKKLNIIAATPSRWFAEYTGKSHIFRDKNIAMVHNGIDVDQYAPVPKDIARNLMNLPQDKLIILFGANNALTDMNKGFQFIPEAIERMKHLLHQHANLELVVFGCQQPSHHPEVGIKTRFLGRIHDELTLKIIYSAADVTLVPSQMESFSNIIMESMACGTTCVSFNIGGPQDLIIHEKNGYLAKPYDPVGLGEGLARILSDCETQDRCARDARSTIENFFDIKKTAQNYLNLYRELLK